jgi:hypothetical protein
MVPVTPMVQKGEETLNALRSGGKSGVSKPGEMCEFPLVFS